MEVVLDRGGFICTQYDVLFLKIIK
jgi:hypothetical protein